MGRKKEGGAWLERVVFYDHLTCQLRSDGCGSWYPLLEGRAWCSRRPERNATDNGIQRVPRLPNQMLPATLTRLPVPVVAASMVAANSLATPSATASAT